MSQTQKGSQEILKQFKQVEDISKKLSAQFQLSQETLNQIKNISKISQRSTEQIKITSETRKEITKNVKPYSDYIQNIVFDRGNLLNKLQDEFLSIEEESPDFEYKWIGFVTISDYKKLQKLWKENKKDEVRDYFYQPFSNKEKIDEIINQIEKNDSIKSRINILRKALYAHLNGDYELSIPIFFAQIDGLFIEKHKDLDGQINTNNKCEKCGSKTKTKSYLTANNISRHLIKKDNKYMPSFLEHINHTFTIFRNDILHGKKLDYANKDLSTKLILTILEINSSDQKL